MDKFKIYYLLTIDLSLWRGVCAQKLINKHRRGKMLEIKIYKWDRIN